MPGNRQISESLIAWLIQRKCYLDAAEVISGYEDHFRTYSRLITGSLSGGASDVRSLLHCAEQESSQHRSWCQALLKSLPNDNDTLPIRSAIRKAEIARLQLLKDVMRVDQEDQRSTSNQVKSPGYQAANLNCRWRQFNLTPDIEFQTGLQNRMRGIERQSYTQMWEDELSRRFRSTTFLPLDPQHKLQNGRLTVVKQLAFGGLSAIYLVQKDQQDLFVLKEAVVPQTADPVIRREAEKHLSRESQLLSTLSHPSIARVLDHFVEDGRTYLLLEYVNGQDLRQFVRQNGPQPAVRVAQWALELTGALHYLHTRQPPVIHRDLTPDNIVLNNKGSLIIIDFGAANEFLGTATGTLIGKQAYIAPEQLRGKAKCQSDLYALGATLFFLLTGRDPLPLCKSSLRTVLPDVPECLDSLVGDLTALELSDRIGSTDQLLSRLEQVLTEI